MRNHRPRPVIAYFSMEMGLTSALPTYAGGLGVLAGDTMRAAADSGADVVGISLLYRHGYFRQKLDESGNQTEADQSWASEEVLQPVAPEVAVEVRGRRVAIRTFEYSVHGHDGWSVPVYLLDTDLPQNDPRDRSIADHLYGGDDEHRLVQETVLGFGGIALLRALGYDDVNVYHMNEGHSALLGLALLEEDVRNNGGGLDDFTSERVEVVRRKCVFTTHTPVPSGHDKFSNALVYEVLGQQRGQELDRLGCLKEGILNMTYLALFFSRYINGVSMRHEQVSSEMFPDYPVNSITNGVHAVTWASDAFRSLYDRRLPEWSRDNGYLRHATSLPLRDIRDAHAASKEALLSLIEQRTGTQFDPSAFTIGFARRATPYKRADLLFHDLERLQRIVEKIGPLQLVYGGKAHPADLGGKEMIRHIFEAGTKLRDDIRLVYLSDYDMDMARNICAGVDLWLNTPHKPYEASGTSGMKAALNGVPSLSVLDGWWVEGCIEGVTGWAIGNDWIPNEAGDSASESTYLYDKLELVIAPMFYNRPDEYAKVMRNAIALNGSFYTAQRMFDQYVRNAYRTIT